MLAPILPRPTIPICIDRSFADVVSVLSKIRKSLSRCRPTPASSRLPLRNSRQIVCFVFEALSANAGESSFVMMLTDTFRWQSGTIHSAIWRIHPIFIWSWEAIVGP